MPCRQILTPDQRERLISPPLDEAHFIRVYTLSAQDLERVHRRRRAQNRLGFAVQLCCIRYPGQVLRSGEAPDPRLLAYVAQQIGVDPCVWPAYAHRDQTRRAHLHEIQSTYGFRTFGSQDYAVLEEWLLPLALRTDQGVILASSLLEEMRTRRLIAPPLSMIEKLCAATMSRAKRTIYKSLTSSLSAEQRQGLGALLERRDGRSQHTLAWLRQPVGTACPANMLELTSRLEVIREFNLPLDLGQGARAPTRSPPSMR